MAGTALGNRLGADLGIDLGVDLAPRATFAGTPDTIIAAGEQKARYRADSGITLNGSRVSGWANMWGNGNLTQATANVQPLLGTLNGRATVLNDTGPRWMSGTLTSAIASGSRMYMWMYVRNSVAAVANKFFGACGTSAANRILSGTFSSNANWSIRNATAGQTVTVDTGLAVDLNRHLVEGGITTDGIAQWVLSGSPRSSTALGVTTADVSVMCIFTTNAIAGSGPTGAVSEMVVMAGEPTAQQTADMRRYFQTYYGTI